MKQAQYEKKIKVGDKTITITRGRMDKVSGEADIYANGILIGYMCKNLSAIYDPSFGWHDTGADDSWDCFVYRDDASQYFSEGLGRNQLTAFRRACNDMERDAETPHKWDGHMGRVLQEIARSGSEGQSSLPMSEGRE